MTTAADDLADALAKLDPFDRRFAEAYAGLAAGNGCKAMELAGHEGDAAVRATLAWRKLRNVDIRAAIEAMVESDPLVPARQERLRIIGAIARGEVPDVRLTATGERVELPTKASDILAACRDLSELAGERVVKIAPTDSAGNDLKAWTMEQLIAITQLKVG